MPIQCERGGLITRRGAAQTRAGVPRTPRWSRQLAVVAMALAFSLALSGCSWLSPASTSFPQIQADGVPLSIGGIEFENLVVVASSRGARGVLTGQAVNTTRHPIDVTVSVKGEGEPARFTLAPMAGDGIVTTPNTVELAAVPVIPGATVMLVVSTSEASEKEVSVPVLPPGSDLDYYDGITP